MIRARLGYAVGDSMRPRSALGMPRNYDVALYLIPRSKDQRSTFVPFTNFNLLCPDLIQSARRGSFAAEASIEVDRCLGLGAARLERASAGYEPSALSS